MDNLQDNLQDNKTNYSLQQGKAIQQVLITEGKVILGTFLLPKEYRNLRTSIIALPFIKTSNPSTHSYQSAAVPEWLVKKMSRTISSLLFSKKSSFFISEGMAYRFTWRDYQILHDSASPHDSPSPREQKRMFKEGTLEVIFDFSDDWNPAGGGAIVYTNLAGTVQKIPPRGNTLLLVCSNGLKSQGKQQPKQQPKQQQSYIQYCNHHSQGKQRYFLRFFLTGQSKA